MKIEKAILLVLLLCLPGATALHAQGKAGQAGEYLRWGIGAKAMGLGRAFTSVADDASAMYWNPAGLAALARSGGTIMFMHLPLSEGSSMNYLGGAIPLRLFFIKQSHRSRLTRAIQQLKLGVGVLWHSLGEFQFYDEIASPVSSGSSNTIGESAILISASYPLSSLIRPWSGTSSGWLAALKGDIELGFTTKILRQNLFDERGTATSFDLGFKYSHLSGLFNLGFTWRDFNSPTFSYKTDLIADTVPAHGTAGISIIPPLGRLRGLMLSFDYSIFPAANSDRDLMFGMEYDFSVLNANYPVKLRLGVNNNQESFTLGLNFSPEELFNQDWLPSADWTYAKTRNGFDAVGARYSFSLDRNPFTAKYWYTNGMANITNDKCTPAGQSGENESILSYMKNAEQAKNPGGHAYRYQAALRIADIKFFAELAALQETPDSGNDYRKAFTKVTKCYTERAAKYLRLDYGKSKLDFTAYYRSFMFYVQALILSGRSGAALEICANNGASWGKKINILQQQNRRAGSRSTDYLNYLRAYAFFYQNLDQEAVQLLQNRLLHDNTGKFLLGHIRFIQGKYRETLKILEEIDLNNTHFPADLYLPITRDCTFGDEVLFLKAVAKYKLSSAPIKNTAFLNEFAGIPRYFPRSDLAHFLTGNDAILGNLINFFEAGDSRGIDELVNKIINSYIRTSSGGTMTEEFYTYNFR